jgi:hypothetical protein
MTGWLAGSAAAPFPIPTGTPLGGYMARTSGATSTLDPLQIGALHLETHGRSLTIVTADVIGVDRELRDRIATASGLDPATIILCASHTHSGPQGIVHRLHPIEPDAEDGTLRNRFVAIAADCVHRARARLEPVFLSIATASAAGSWTNRNAPEGPADRRLRLLATQRGDGAIQTIIAHTPCHPTVLGAESSAVSADLSGGIRRAISAFPEMAGVTILSLTGSAGDISTRYVRQAATPAEIDRLAANAVRNVREALRSAHGIAATESSLQRRTVSIALPTFREDLSADPHAEMVAAREAMVAAQGNATPPALRQAITRYQGALLRWQMAGSGDTGETKPIPATLVSLDDATALAALPVELFTSLGATIERASPFAETVIVGYANGYAGYVADAAAWDAGTYEALASPFARRAGDVLTEGVIEALRGLRGGIGRA